MTVELGGRVLVGIGQAHWSADPTQVLVARPIGASGALALWDPGRRAGGVLHWLVPDIDCHPARAVSNPGLFAETGIPFLIRGLEGLGARMEDIQAVLAGAASLWEAGISDVGARNRAMAHSYLNQHGIQVSREETGGFIVRELSLEIGSGKTSISCQSL